MTHPRSDLEAAGLSAQSQRQLGHGGGESVVRDSVHSALKWLRSINPPNNTGGNLVTPTLQA